MIIVVIDNSLAPIFTFWKFLWLKVWSINCYLFEIFLFLLRLLLLIVSSMYFISDITHFRLWKLRLLFTLELYILYLNIRSEWFTKRKLWSKTSVKPKMALYGFKTGNATFSERHNRSQFHKFCAYMHS